MVMQSGNGTAASTTERSKRAELSVFAVGKVETSGNQPAAVRFIICGQQSITETTLHLFTAQLALFRRTAVMSPEGRDVTGVPTALLPVISCQLSQACGSSQTVPATLCRVPAPVSSASLSSQGSVTVRHPISKSPVNMSRGTAERSGLS